eukprot:Gregarina_sp_Poly_1__8041@NODE_461_length_8201_cov_115_438530_g375_i0_p4_GENE_NODE_461_length_8201_cov_115_438530_g375_i0NODE_461_length_8201_cov_115_438530_g375_i0_p4_ORF_typecomplete_len387_score67_31PseudoU_synth_2/PF00849_22/3_8e22_NODE_461_length_8201_cov_115_438530_g375_i033074467
MEAAVGSLLTEHLKQCDEKTAAEIASKFIASLRDQISKAFASTETAQTSSIETAQVSSIETAEKVETAAKVETAVSVEKILTGVEDRDILDGVVARLHQLVASRRDADETETADIKFLQTFPEYLFNVVRVIYEDSVVVVIAKPFDFRIDLGKNETAQSFANEPHLRRWFESRYPGIPFRMCHQLDYATSGLMILALSQRSCAKINKEFFQRRVRKDYLALVEGAWDSEKLAQLHTRGPIRASFNELTNRLKVEFLIGRSTVKSKSMTVVNEETPGAQYCMTEIEVLELQTLCRNSGSVLSLTKLRLFPHTGRTHQLRVTTSALGHPILGDRKYGERGADVVWDKIHRELPRMYLHAHSLALQLMDGKLKTFTSPPECFLLGAFSS